MLHNLQQSFKQGILENTVEIQGLIKESKGQNKAELLEVYRNTTFVSLKKCLTSTFPAVEALVSKDFMHYACHEFIKKHPPSHGALLFYGAEFADFLQTFTPTKNMPYIADIARLEWALSEAYDAEDAPYIQSEDFAKESIERLSNQTFKLSPHVHLLTSPFPIYSIWQMTHTPENEQNINMEQSECVLVYRNYTDLKSYALPLSLGYFTLLKSLKKGHTLAESITFSLHQEPALCLEKTLADILNRGLLKKGK